MRWFSLTPDIADIEISVTDTGIGISQDKLNSIFNKFSKFSQADGFISRSYGGMELASPSAK